MLEDDFYYSDPLYRNTHKYVCSIDLQRFAIDDFGSSVDNLPVFV